MWGRACKKKRGNAYDVCYKLRDGELKDIPDSVLRKLLLIMARISEKSYRRGAQQGFTICADTTFEKDRLLRYDLSRGTFRYDFGLDDAPNHWVHRKSSKDIYPGTTSVDWIGIECGRYLSRIFGYRVRDLIKQLDAEITSKDKRKQD